MVERLRQLSEVNVMTEADAEVLLPKSSRYSGMEVLIPASTTCTWEKNDLSNLRRVRFCDEYILRIFGKRNGVRARALQRLRNGHFFLDTLESAQVKKRASRDDSAKELTVIRCNVLASQRADVYRTYVVVNEDGHYVRSPYSRCSCAAGNMFCAHMLGLLCFCGLCKMNPTWKRKDFQERMPSNTDELQRQVIPISIMFEKNLNCRPE